MNIASNGRGYRLAVFTAVALAAGAAGAASAASLTPQGLGKVRIGMSLSEAEQALSAGLSGDTTGETCRVVGRADGKDPGISYMIEKGRITRIDIATPAKGAPPRVTTAHGIGLGASLDEVRRRYGAGVKLEPAEIEPGTRLVHVETARGRGTVLEIRDGKVTSFRSGLRAAIDYSEGCS